jgi:hypothetical protein
MFKDELFINEAIISIYGIEKPENHNFSGTKEQPHISDSDYEVLDKFLKNKQDTDLKILIGGLNMLAYGFKNDRSIIINHIKNNSSLIMQQIDRVVPNLWDDYNEVAIQYYNKILDSKFSYNLIKNLDVPHPPKLSEKYFYGLKYLLLFWATCCYDDFEKWYFSTERKDLLLCFIATILESHYIINATNKTFTESKIHWLRALNNLLIYPISNTFPFADKETKVADITNSPITNKEKLDLLLYYLFQNFGTLNGAYEENNKEDFYQIINLLKKVDIGEYFSIDYIKSLNLWIYRYYIIVEILTNIDINDKESMYEYILSLIDKYQEKDILTASDIALANLYGHILLNLGDDYLVSTEKHYLNIKRDLLKPYFYSRKHDKWNRHIAKIIFYTIVLFIVNYPDKEKCTILIEDFIKMKKGLRHYLDEDLNSFLHNMREQLFAI